VASEQSKLLVQMLRARPVVAGPSVEEMRAAISRCVALEPST